VKPKFILCFPFLLAGILFNGSTNAAELRVSSNFPGGSARVLSLDQDNNFVRIMPAGNPAHGWPNWWFFRLDGADTNKPIVLEVVANQESVQTDTPGQFRKLPANWSLPERAAFSSDGTNWEHTAKGKRQGDKMVYQINTAVPALWLAWGPPFALKDADQVIREICRRSPDARNFVLARTLGGRPVPGVRISEPGAANSPRYGVWIQARQHAWESGSSWVARGFLEWLVSDDPDAQSLRRKADITVIPIMDVDSVETGQGGKDQMPHDQNRDWGTTTYFPEVGAAKDRLAAMMKADQLDLFLDLHDPAATDRVIDFYIPPLPLLFPQRIVNEDDFLAIIQEQVTGPIPFTGTIKPLPRTYDPEKNKSSDTWPPARSAHHVVSLTMEIPWNIPGSTPSGYLKTGAQLGRSISLYLQPKIRPESEITTNVPPRFWPTTIFSQ
jgi:hypothetical protein